MHVTAVFEKALKIHRIHRKRFPGAKTQGASSSFLRKSLCQTI